jgi:hypothetical protein
MPDHKASVMSSGSGNGGFGRRVRAALVASAIGTARVFLRDIRVLSFTGTVASS